MSCNVLYLLSSNVIELASLTNTVTGVIDNGATVTVTIKDPSGQSVSGETWPRTMSLASESPLTGTYRATLSHALGIEASKRYKACISIIGSGGERDYREVPLMARIRSAD